MQLNHSLENFEFESYCFVDENDFETFNDHSGSNEGNPMLDNTNFSYSTDYSQILLDQINQLQRNNEKLIEIEQRYKIFINSLIETVQKRDRTVMELELKLSRNASNLIKLQQFLKTKLNEMEIYKQKYVREKALNQRLTHSEEFTVSASLHPDGIDELENCDILQELSEICLMCEHKISIPSHLIREDNCSGGVVLEECHE